MKAWSISGVSCLLGVAVGVGTVFWQFDGTRADFDVWYAAGSAVVGSDSGDEFDSGKVGRAKIKLEGGSEYQFGVMSLGESRSHAFRVKNEGTAPLTLHVVEKTCMCTDVELPPDSILPGETADIVMHWNARKADLDFHHSATLETSDPNRRLLKLSIQGQVRQIVGADPPEVSFSRILAHKPHSTDVVVYGYRYEDLAIDRFELLQEDTAGSFQIDARPVSAEEVAKERGARCGIIITITVQPGLPLGPINQRLRLHFTSADLDPLEIPIKGSVVSEISILPSRRFDAESNLIKFGPVSPQKGDRVTLYVVVKGPHRHEVRLTPQEVFPDDVLRVSVGEAEELRNGVAVMIPVTVEIPAGARSAIHLGSQQGEVGRILLQTNHPKAPTLQLYVSFMVGDFN